MSESHIPVEWKARPREEAALFNPASWRTYRSRRDRSRKVGGYLHFSLAFLILLLVLPPVTRAKLPGRSDTAFRSWAVDNDVISPELPERTVNLKGMTREALLFMIQHDALALSGGAVTVGEAPMVFSRRPQYTTSEVDEMRRAARFLGRWFANQSGAKHILQTLGLRP
jgi:hypothetical protein